MDRFNTAAWILERISELEDTSKNLTDYAHRMTKRLKT